MQAWCRLCACKVVKGSSERVWEGCIVVGSYGDGTAKQHAPVVNLHANGVEQAHHALVLAVAGVRAHEGERQGRQLGVAAGKQGTAAKQLALALIV